MTTLPDFPFDNSYHRDLSEAYVAWDGAKAPSPKLLRFNAPLAEELGLDAEALAGEAGALVFSGTEAPTGAAPLAMAYAGHQFGGFSPQLGDGRAILLGELIDRNGRRRDLHLKGSGRTPFARGGDGKAALAPVLREYLLGEAMYALGIPTTRALGAATTGEKIHRDGAKDGAVLARVAASHLRVGSFQFFAARGDIDTLRKLADYAIGRHDPDLARDENRYVRFIERVAERQAALIAEWVGVGFVHGVMNTDNMTISGETIDYGPCAFIDIYDPRAVFSSIDQHGRYAFGNQPNIAQWNLARLAESLLDLIDPDDSDAAIEAASKAVNRFPGLYQEAWLAVMRRKLGLERVEEGDLDLANDLFKAMEGQQVDYTALFRALAADLRDEAQTARALFTAPQDGFDAWYERFAARVETGGAARMDAANPLYIPRNHLVEGALEAAEAGDMAPFDKLLGVLQSPFTEQAGMEDYTKPAPESFGKYVTFCGT